MITIRRAQDRGGADHGWLKTAHSFSFGEYYDPENMGYHNLRVMNEDFIAPNNGFPMHAHDNMEIFTYVIEGSLEHRDSMGNIIIIKAGDIQKMSAGSGIKHSEINPSSSDTTHLYQIWVQPDTVNIEPMHAELKPDFGEIEAELKLILSPTPSEEVLPIQQDMQVYLGRLNSGKSLEQATVPERYYWVQVLTGALEVNGESMTAGDGAILEDESNLTFNAHEDSTLMLFDMA